MSIKDNLDRETYGDLMYRLGQMDAILQDLQGTISRFHEESRRIREGQPPHIVRALDEVLQRNSQTQNQQHPTHPHTDDDDVIGRTPAAQEAEE